MIVLNFIVNELPNTNTWMRSPHERCVQKDSCRDVIHLINKYISTTSGAKILVMTAEKMAREEIDYESLRENFNVVMCVGTDTDGMRGPSVSFQLENAGIDFCGYSGEFYWNTVDKNKQRKILNDSGIPVKPHIVVKTRDLRRIPLPVTVCIADSYASSPCDVFHETQMTELISNYGQFFPMFIVQDWSERTTHVVFVAEDKTFVDGEDCQEIRKLAMRAFDALGGAGLAVVSMIRDSKGIYVQDVRTTVSFQIDSHRF